MSKKPYSLFIRMTQHSGYLVVMAVLMALFSRSCSNIDPRLSVVFLKFYWTSSNIPDGLIKFKSSLMPCLHCCSIEWD